MADEGSGAPGQPAAERPDLDLLKLTLEQEKTRLDYKKFLYGSVFAAIAIAFIPPAFQLATAVLEYVKSEAKLRIDEQNAKAERDAKEVEFRQNYIRSFVANALDQDIELRIRLAEYFTKVSADALRDGWGSYHKTLVDQRNDIRGKIDKLEADWRLQAPAGQSVEVDRIERNLAWLYKEVGYVERNRSAAGARASEPTTIGPDAQVIASPVSGPQQRLPSSTETGATVQIKEIQVALGVLPDGLLGVGTRYAIREFQQGLYRRDPRLYQLSQVGSATSAVFGSGVVAGLGPMPAVFLSPFERAYLGSDPRATSGSPLSSIDETQLVLALQLLGATPEAVKNTTTNQKLKVLRDLIPGLRSKYGLAGSASALDAALFSAVWKESPLNVNRTD